ncbi:MAG: hypothetical protein IOC49_07950 [Methylobacterium sp.]|nr:hypothetical protein [Methylobacterium sp.]
MSRIVIKPPKKTGASSVRIKASPQASISKNHTHPELSKSARAPDVKGRACAGSAPSVPAQSQVPAQSRSRKKIRPGHGDREARRHGLRAGEGGSGALSPHQKRRIKNAVPRTLRQERRAENFVRLMRTEMQGWVGSSKS